MSCISMFTIQHVNLYTIFPKTLFQLYVIGCSSITIDEEKISKTVKLVHKILGGGSYSIDVDENDIIPGDAQKYVDIIGHVMYYNVSQVNKHGERTTRVSMHIQTLMRQYQKSCINLSGAFAAKYLTYLETHPNEPYVIIHLYRCLKIGKMGIKFQEDKSRMYINTDSDVITDLCKLFRAKYPAKFPLLTPPTQIYSNIEISKHGSSSKLGDNTIAHKLPSKRKIECVDDNYSSTGSIEKVLHKVTIDTDKKHKVFVPSKEE
ncbi:hypothetical protein LXL04_011184 [Taraxacum kok-saghyz]